MTSWVVFAIIGFQPLLIASIMLVTMYYFTTIGTGVTVMGCRARNPTRPFNKPTTMMHSISPLHSPVWMRVALCIGGPGFQVEMFCTLLLWISASRLPLCSVQLFLGRHDHWRSKTGSQPFWIIGLMPLLVSSRRGFLLLQVPWRKLKQGHQTSCSPVSTLMNMCEVHTTAVRHGRAPSPLRRS